MNQPRKLLLTDYPLQLRQISRLPESMDMVGTLPGPEYKFLCVVGSRHSSSYGRAVCEELVKGLAGFRIAIVSGLAIGIDSIAHESALAVGLKAVAFPGSGLSSEVFYPASSRRLAEKIVERGGAVISPFEADQMGTKWTFPMRNRLMAGLSHATLIIEGGKRSGTLLTAGNAAEFGRDILAVPGSIFSELSYGPHALIRDGAIPISSSADILNALGFQIESTNPDDYVSIAELALSPEEKRLVAELRLSPLSSTEAMERAALDASQFSICASRLEIQGVIEERGGRYRLMRTI